MQERLLKNIPNKEEIIFNVRRLIDVYKILNLNILYTEQNPNKLGNSITIVKEKLDCKGISKMTFSCAEISYIKETLEKNKIKKIILTGIETHICIQQTAIEFLLQGYKVYIVVDASGSQNQLDKDIAFKRLEKEGALLTTTEALIFELCKTSDRKEFKEISNIVKESI